MNSTHANYTKSISDIVRHHIAHNRLNTTHDSVMETLNNAIKNGFKIIRFNNVLFAVKQTQNSILLSIINGDSPKDYVRALRKFVTFFKSKGIHRFGIYVQDQDSATHIGMAAGLHDLKFTHSGIDMEDPYLMVGEV